MSSFKRLGLWVQHVLAQISIPFTFGVSLLLMKGILGYRWENLKEFRRNLRTILRARRPGPLLICPNHLTMIDSLILVWATTPWWKAITQPWMFPWNTPEKRNYAHVGPLRFFTYLGKCLPVVRQGPPSQTKLLMEKIMRLLGWGQSLMMFPEGARSQTGRVDTANFAYGVGKIIDDARNEGLDPQVLLLYLRGRSQTAKSSVPRRREIFRIQARLIDPRTTATGLRASRDLSTQIIRALAEMEEDHFRS